MIAWWRGENNTSEEAGARNGTFSGSALYASGMVGQAFSFNGGNGISVPLDALWSWNTTKFTIELWARFNSVPGTAPFMAQDLGGGKQSKWIFMEEASNLRFHTNSPGTGALYPANTPWSVSVGPWYHVAVTRNGDEYKLYINGVNVSTSTDAHAIPRPNVPLTIGEAEGLHFVGALDEVTMYNATLTASKIAAIHAAGSHGKCPNTTLTVASNGPYTGAENADVAFTAAGTSSPAGARKYQWSFGDGTTSTKADPSHKYGDNGNYAVKLIERTQPAYPPDRIRRPRSATSRQQRCSPHPQRWQKALHTRWSSRSQWMVRSTRRRWYTNSIAAADSMAPSARARRERVPARPNHRGS